MTHPADQPADGPAGRDVPAATPAAQLLFGADLDVALHYAGLLAGDGAEHGHLGPREIPRLWDRHLANSAVVTDLVPPNATVVDVGSGAGLPGLPMAIRRRDLRVVLVEPMLRRSAFLERAVVELDLVDRVLVVRGRAEDPATRAAVGPDTWVTARAVAPLGRLVGWCLPLVGPTGRLLAVKGATAAAEVADFRATASAAVRGAVAEMDVVQVGREYGMDPTHVIRVQRHAQRRRSR